ncbi:MAG: hypothetical protein C4343_00950 [Chloroflexota bacterium]
MIPRRPEGGQGRLGPHLGPLRLTPARISLGIALGGALLLFVYALLRRDELQVPLLASSALVIGLVFAAFAVAGAVATYRAAADSRGGEALVLAIVGGCFAVGACGAFAAALVLALLWRSG